MTARARPDVVSLALWLSGLLCFLLVLQQGSAEQQAAPPAAPTFTTPSSNPLVAALRGLPQCANFTTKTPFYSVDFLGPQRTIVAGNVRYAYHRFGPTNAALSNPANATAAPPIIMIMGYGGTMYDWPLPALQVFSRDREVVIFDNMCIGNSSCPPSANTSGISIIGMASSTIDLVGALNFTKKPDVIGWSMGGFISLTIAARHGSAIHDVTIVASQASGPSLLGGPTAIQELNPDATQPPEEAALGLFPQGVRDPGFCVGLASQSSNPYYSPAAASRYARELQYKAIGQYVCDASINYDLLPTVRNRVLFFAGMQDRLIPITSVMASAARIPGAWVSTLAGAGHAVLISFPYKFTSIVLDFLSQVDPMTEEAAAFARYGAPTNCTQVKQVLANVSQTAAASRSTRTAG